MRSIDDAAAVAMAVVGICYGGALLLGRLGAGGVGLGLANAGLVAAGVGLAVLNVVLLAARRARKRPDVR